MKSLLKNIAFSSKKLSVGNITADNVFIKYVGGGVYHLYSTDNSYGFRIELKDTDKVDGDMQEGDVKIISNKDFKDILASRSLVIEGDQFYTMKSGNVGRHKFIDPPARSEHISGVRGLDGYINQEGEFNELIFDGIMLEHYEKMFKVFKGGVKITTLDNGAVKVKDMEKEDYMIFKPSRSDKSSDLTFDEINLDFIIKENLKLRDSNLKYARLNDGWAEVFTSRVYIKFKTDLDLTDKYVSVEHLPYIMKEIERTTEEGLYIKIDNLGASMFIPFKNIDTHNVYNRLSSQEVEKNGDIYTGEGILELIKIFGKTPTLNLYGSNNVMHRFIGFRQDKVEAMCLI